MLRVFTKLGSLGLLVAVTWASVGEICQGQLLGRWGWRNCCYDPCYTPYYGTRGYGFREGYYGARPFARGAYTNYYGGACCAVANWGTATYEISHQPAPSQNGMTNQGADPGRMDTRSEFGTQTRQPQQGEPNVEPPPGDREYGDAYQTRSDLTLDADGYINGFRQDPGDPVQQDPPRRPGDPALQDPLRQNPSRQDSVALPTGMNEFLASKLVLCNNAMIECAQKAIARTSNQEVKDLAQTIVDEHLAFNRKLQPLTADYAAQAVSTHLGRSNLAGVDRTGDQGVGENVQGAAGQQRTLQETAYSARASCYANVFKIAEKTQAQVGEVVEQSLADASNEAFDQKFVGLQVMSHEMLLAELKVISETQMNSQLQAVANEIKGKVEQHLVRAKELKEQLAE